jgi:hypothetical protein
MKHNPMLLESGKSLAVIVLGFLYFAAVNFLTGFAAAHSSYPTWAHAVLTRHAYGEFTIRALWYDFLRYFVPAFLVAYLASLFRPCRWFAYSLFLVGPYAAYILAMSWLYPLPVGVPLLDEPNWKIIYWIGSSVLLYALPPAILWSIYKIRKQKVTAQD